VGKNPAFQFYPMDWQRDLDEHSLEIEGAWIRICCRLWWAPQRGRLTLRPERWAVILRKDLPCTNRIIDYLLNEKIARGQREANGYITLWSKRMVQDDKDREYNRLRQQRFQRKNKTNANITPDITATSQRSSSSSLSSIKNKERGKRTSPFVPPSINEVKEYCTERKNMIDAQAFVDFYISNGWQVGKNKMRDWKAAVRTWEKRHFHQMVKTSVPVKEPPRYKDFPEPQPMPKISEEERKRNLEKVGNLLKTIG